MLSGVERDSKMYHTAEGWVLHCTWGYTYSEEGVAYMPLSRPHPLAPQTSILRSINVNNISTQSACLQYVM